MRRRDFLKVVGVGAVSLAMADESEELPHMLIEWRKAVNAPVPTQQNIDYDPAVRR